MKVSFLTTPIGGIIGVEMITFVEPLGLECVAGALEPDGHECQIVDLRIGALEAGLQRVWEFQPEIVGVQCSFTTQRFRVIRMAQRVKRDCPKALVVVGGHDASRDPEWFLREGVDAVVVGDGEEVFPSFVRTYAEDGDLSKVPGVVLKGPAGPVHCGPAPARRQLDDLPMAARHLVADYADEYYINFHKPLALVETARGCPFKCNFCSVWKFHESTFREKTPERVVEELRNTSAPNVFFTDDIFWMNAKRARELAKAIKEAGIHKRFNIQTRTDIICKFPELIDLWKDCGKLTIFLGLEKIDDQGLDSVNKSNTAEINNRAIEIVKQSGVGYAPNFIVDPSWERKDFDKLKRWIDRTGSYGAGFSILTPLPGTDLWDTAKQDLLTEDWELFDLAHAVLPTRLPLHEFYKEYCGLWAHALDVRFEIHGRLKSNLEILAALATRKVSIPAMRRGMRMGRTLSRPKRFYHGHEASIGRLEKHADLLVGLPSATESLTAEAV